VVGITNRSGVITYRWLATQTLPPAPSQWLQHVAWKAPEAEARADCVCMPASQLQLFLLSQRQMPMALLTWQAGMPGGIGPGKQHKWCRLVTHILTQPCVTLSSVLCLDWIRAPTIVDDQHRAVETACYRAPLSLSTQFNPPEPAPQWQTGGHVGCRPSRTPSGSTGREGSGRCPRGRWGERPGMRPECAGSVVSMVSQHAMFCICSKGEFLNS
jgi:hypothetical protein